VFDEIPTLNTLSCYDPGRMKGEKKELWMRLCEQAAVEQDPERLLQLTQEINRLLNEKEERLKNLRLKPGGDSSR